MTIDYRRVSQLIQKDWQLHEKMIAAYVGGGILGLAIVGLPHIYAFYMGLIILLTVIAAAGFHGITLTIVNEKKNQTLPFIMSLPVRPAEYTLAKLAANVLMFFIPWFTTFVGLIFLTLTTDIPNGILAFFILIGIQLVANYALVLGTVIVTESEGWFIVVMVLVNLALNPFIMLLAQNPQFNQHFDSPSFAWNATATGIVSIQLAVTVLALLYALVRQSRRLTFI